MSDSAGDIGGAGAAPESLEAFLADVERRAFRMAYLATGRRDEALDLVQEAMMSFVRSYRSKPPAERRPLFFRTLDNRLRDWHRRETVRRRWLLPWLRFTGAPGEEAADWEPADPGPGPSALADGADFAAAAQRALAVLPHRQRQAFLLRAGEGLDVAAAARAMGVTPGSVKTHYFRAVHALRAALEDYR